MGYKVHFLLENSSHFSYDKQTNIFIGTPYEIENNLTKLNNDFDYVVFDEIHNINKEDDGDVYENIIKLMDCNFLALSATIKNVEFLKDIFNKNFLNKKINYIEYNKRFINHQKWIWNKNNLVKLHPLCSFNKLTVDFVTNDLSFTPNDCATLWNCIENEFENDEEIVQDFSPDEYFKQEKLLTLDDCSDYESFIKQKMNDINEKYPEKIQNIFNHFQSVTNKKDDLNDHDIIKFLRKLKHEKMLPMIMFHIKEESCKNIFYKIYNYLNHKEIEEYPYHYLILEKKNKLYDLFISKKEQFIASIQIKSKNSQYELREKIENFESKEKDQYINTIRQYYEQKINFVQNNDSTKLIRDLQSKNLKKELNLFLKNPDFNKQDVFKKHSDFIFTDQPMSGDIIRDVRKEIIKTLNIKIPYESPLFQMLKRGIGIYSENMPEEYNWILQKLLSKKYIAIIISDKTLCLGIDLPIRSTCFLGIDEVQFTKDEYLQMAGRAGRRGHDNRGNIIFYGNIDYLSLMDGNLPMIIGNKNPIYSNYTILKDINKNIYSEKIFTNFIHKDRKMIQINDSVSENKLLFWYLRNFKKSSQFINNLYSIETELFQKNNNEKNIILLNNIFEFTDININHKEKIMEIYQLKKMIDYNEIFFIKQLINIFIYIHNNIHNKKYKDMYETSENLFAIFNLILFNFSLFI